MEPDPGEFVSVFHIERSATGYSVSIQGGRPIPSSNPAAAVRSPQMDSVALVPEDFDQIAIVVDWLDACRRRDLKALVDLYDEAATLECRCDGADLYTGRLAVENYWRSRLDTLVPTAFGLEEIQPTADGVALDYLNHEGNPVRIVFVFAADGRILQTHCVPVSQTS
jgi:ketosteroid isomerase-like protein